MRAVVVGRGHAARLRARAFSLGVFRFLLGIGEAGNWPGAVKVVAEWFPEQERALASGIFNSGSAVGAILAPPIVAFLLLRWTGSRHSSFVGITGLVWLHLLGQDVLHARSRAEDASRARAASPCRTPAHPLRHRLHDLENLPRPGLVLLHFLVPEISEGGAPFRSGRASAKSPGSRSWSPASAIFSAAGCPSALLRRGVSTTVARKASVTFFAALMLSAIPAVLADETWLSIAFVSIAMLGYTGALANMLTIPSDVFPQNAVASVYGLASMGSGFGGMVFTLITGWVVEHYSYTPVFFGFAVLPLICASILWSVAGPARAGSGRPPGLPSARHFRPPRPRNPGACLPCRSEEHHRSRSCFAAGFLAGASKKCKRGPHKPTQSLTHVGPGGYPQVRCPSLYERFSSTLPPLPARGHLSRPAVARPAHHLRTLPCVRSQVRTRARLLPRCDVLQLHPVDPTGLAIVLLIWRITHWQFDIVMGCAFLAYLPLVPVVSRWARVLWMYVDRRFDP